MKGKQWTGRAYLPGFVPVEVAMAVLGSSTRFEIVRYLAVNGETCSSAIADGLELAFNVISNHLTILREHGILTERRDGRRHFYSLGHSVQAKLARGLLHLEIACGEDLLAIRAKPLTAASIAPCASSDA